MADPPPNSIEIAPGLSVPERVLSFTFARSGGPGGQNVNKLNSKAILRVSLADLAPFLDWGTLQRLRIGAGKSVTDADELLIACEESRSAQGNKQECIEKLRDMILRARVRPKVRKKTKPSRGSKERRIESKKRRGDIKRGRGGGFE
jgi:ribosome-associated protein